MAALTALTLLFLAVLALLAAIASGVASLPVAPPQAPGIEGAAGWLVLGTAIGLLGVVQAVLAAALLRRPWARPAQIGLSCLVGLLGFAGGVMVAPAALAILVLALVIFSYTARAGTSRHRAGPPPGAT